MDKKNKNWEISAGFFPGILFGVRSYEDGEFQTDHVLYIGFIDICLTFYYEK